MKGKEVSSQNIDEVAAPVDEAERSIKNPGAGSMRQWSKTADQINVVCVFYPLLFCSIATKKEVLKP